MSNPNHVTQHITKQQELAMLLQQTVAELSLELRSIQVARLKEEFGVSFCLRLDSFDTER